MQLAKKAFCNWNFSRLVPEKIVRGQGYTISITTDNKKEVMIFLGARTNNSGYEVRVYKNNVADKYIPHELDNVQSYEENSKYATFIFANYPSANNFVSSLAYRHKEYMVRPTQVQIV